MPFKEKCEKMGRDIIRKAEKVGELIAVTDQLEKNQSIAEPSIIANDPDIMKLRVLRKKEIQTRRYAVEVEEADLMDKLLDLIQCEQG